MPGSVSHLFNFTDNRFVQLQHRVKVFIFGQDVSTHLKGSLSITYGGRDSFNTASFELSNPKHIWQLTEANLKGKWRLTKGEYSESIKARIFKLKNNPDFNASYKLDVTETQLGESGQLKTLDPRILMSPVTNEGDVKYSDPGTDRERKYRLAVNDCIFNRHDPIRIFILNPYMPRDAEQWMEVFCGFVNQHPITTNYVTSESTLRIDCYCIKQLIAKMRVQTNPCLPALDPQPLFSTGFFKDNFQDGGIFTHPLSETSLEDSIKSLILGKTKGEPTFEENYDAPNVSGVGNFRLGNVVCYDPASPKSTLVQWHLMSMFGVNKKAYPTGPDDDLWLTKKEMYIIGQTTCPVKGGQAVAGPTGRYLHMLLPKEGTGAGSITAYTIDQTAQAREWITRWEMIRDLLSRLDFQIITSPSGDLLVEFPLYGFTPCAFKVSTPSNKCDKPNGLQGLLTFDRHQKEDTLNDEAEDFPTVLHVSGGNAMTATDPTTNAVVPGTATYIYSPVLVDRYGVIVEATNLPWVGQGQGKETGTKSMTRRLGLLGLLEYIKRMADASTWTGSVVFRPFLLPNRPVELKQSARVGLITSVTHSWNIGKDASTSFSIHQLMAKRADGSYRMMTGAVNVPIDYASIWSIEDETAPLGGNDGKHGVHDGGTDAIKGGTAAPTGTPGAPATATNSAMDVKSPGVSSNTTGMLWPPFKAKIDAMLELAAKNGINFSVFEGYRSVARQTAIKKSFIKKGKGNFAAEPFGSYHQYGLAVDLTDKDSAGGSISDEKSTAFLALAQECKPYNVILTGGVNWASPHEPWHFDVRSMLPGGTFKAMKNTLVNEVGADGGKGDEKAAVTKCHMILDAALGTKGQLNGPLAPDLMTAATNIAGTTPATPGAVAEKCTGQFLQQSDLAKRKMWGGE